MNNMPFALRASGLFLPAYHAILEEGYKAERTSSCFNGLLKNQDKTTFSITAIFLRFFIDLEGKPLDDYNSKTDFDEILGTFYDFQLEPEIRIEKVENSIFLSVFDKIYWGS